MGESTESFSVQVDGQGLVRNDKNVDSQVKLFASYQKRIHDVPRYNVWLSLRTIWLPPQLIFPLSDVLKFIEKKDTFSLTLSDWLHDPNLAHSFELLNKETVVSWKVIGRWQEVKVGGFVVLAISLQLLLVPFQIFDHQVFPR